MSSFARVITPAGTLCADGWSSIAAQRRGASPAVSERDCQTPDGVSQCRATRYVLLWTTAGNRIKSEPVQTRPRWRSGRLTSLLYITAVAAEPIVLVARTDILQPRVRAGEHVIWNPVTGEITAVRELATTPGVLAGLLADDVLIPLSVGDAIQAGQLLADAG